MCISFNMTCFIYLVMNLQWGSSIWKGPSRKGLKTFTRCFKRGFGVFLSLLSLFYCFWGRFSILMALQSEASVAGKLSKYSWMPWLIYSLIRSFNSFMALFNFLLFSSVLACYHCFRMCIFSAILTLTTGNISLFSRDGTKVVVANHAAYCIFFVKYSTAISISTSVFTSWSSEIRES